MSNTDKVKEIVTIIRRTSDLETAKATMGPVLQAELPFQTKVTFDGNVASIYVEESPGNMVLLSVVLS